MIQEAVKLNKTSPEDLNNVRDGVETLLATGGVFLSIMAGIKSFFSKEDPQSEDTKEIVEKLDIKVHSVFNNLESYKYDIGEFNGVNNKGVIAVYSLVLKKHIELFEKYVNMLEETYSTGKISSKSELYYTCNKMTNHLNKELYSFHLGEYYLDDEEVKSVSIVLGHFKRWGKIRSVSRVDKTYEVTQSSLYPSLFNALIAVLDIVDMSVINTIYDAKTLAQQEQVELKGLHFKGELM